MYSHILWILGVQEGLGDYDIIEKPAIYPHISWIWGGTKKGFDYDITPTIYHLFFYDIVHDIAYDMQGYTI
jgi:hypothetical protein